MQDLHGRQEIVQLDLGVGVAANSSFTAGGEARPPCASRCRWSVKNLVGFAGRCPEDLRAKEATLDRPHAPHAQQQSDECSDNTEKWPIEDSKPVHVEQGGAWE